MMHMSFHIYNVHKKIRKIKKGQTAKKFTHLQKDQV